MILFDFEWNELVDKFGDFDSQYQAFAPDVFWVEEYGCWCTAVQDMTRSYDDGEIIEIFILTRDGARCMYE